MKRAVIYTDGASSGNPGPSGIGVAITLGGRTIEIAEHIGIATNNIAEYSAVIRGLREASDLGAAEVEVYMDSELCVRQLNGKYKVKNEGIKPLHAEATRLLSSFSKHSVSHVRREENKLADKLSKKGADPACKPFKASEGPAHAHRARPSDKPSASTVPAHKPAGPPPAPSSDKSPGKPRKAPGSQGSLF